MHKNSIDALIEDFTDKFQNDIGPPTKKNIRKEIENTFIIFYVHLRKLFVERIVVLITKIWVKKISAFLAKCL